MRKYLRKTIPRPQPILGVATTTARRVGDTWDLSHLGLSTSSDRAGGNWLLAPILARHALSEIAHSELSDRCAMLVQIDPQRRRVLPGFRQNVRYPLTSRERMLRLQTLAEEAALRSSDSTRHKCFVSYHVDDIDEVEQFINEFGSEFIPRSVGVTIEDDFVNSSDEDYIKRRIREKYLADSTVTIVLLGKCTWARKFVDWEISSSLRNDTSNRRSGLLVYPMPSMNNSATLPDRVSDNWTKDNEANSYALYRQYPNLRSRLRTDIDNAFDARTAKGHLVVNSRALKDENSSCA